MYVSKIFTEAPTDERRPEELETFALLKRLDIPFTRVEHDMAKTIADCADVETVLGTPICKNLFLCNRQKTDLYLLVMPGEKPFQTKELSHQIGTARLSFAPPELLEEVLHCPPGSASILGLAYDTAHRVRLLMDRETYEAPYLGCHPCICTSSLKLKTADVLHKFLPHTGHEVTVVDL
jgi:Ala-tRNA(Pro) deacylase